MPKHLAPLLLGIVSVALMAQTSLPSTPTAQQAANLKGCANLGVDTRAYTDPHNWYSTLPSPDGTYVAEGRRLATHNSCYDLVFYQCTTQQASRAIGCDDGFPESKDVVVAQQWISNHELQVIRAGKTQVIDALNQFDPDPNGANFYDHVLGVSPDGQWQILYSFRDRMPELYQAHPDGTDVQRLTHSLDYDGFYGWSSDGKWMILDEAQPEQSGKLPARMRSDQLLFEPLMTETEIAQSKEGNWTTLALSPDAQWLLMEGYADDPITGVFHSAMYRLGVPEGGLTRLTDSNFLYDFYGWSPDERALIAHWSGDDQEHVFELLDVVNGIRTALFEGKGAQFKRWTADQKAGLFTIYDPLTAAENWFEVALDGTHKKAINPPG